MALPKSPIAVRVDNFLERHGKLTSLVSIVGLAMGLMSAAYIGLRGFIQSADPVGAGFLILGLTMLLAGVLGHSNTKVTELYSHLLPGHMEDARNVVSFAASTGPAALAARQKWRTADVGRGDAHEAVSGTETVVTDNGHEVVSIDGQAVENGETFSEVFSEKS